MEFLKYHLYNFFLFLSGRLKIDNRTSLLILLKLKFWIPEILRKPISFAALKISLSVFFLLLNFILALSSHAQTNVKQTNISNFDKNFKILGAEVISGYPVEGNLIVARTNPSNKIKINNEFLEIDESGIFVFGFHRDEENPIKLVIINNENEQFKTSIKPIKRVYKIQRIDGLKKSMVTPPEDTISRIKSDRKKVNKARKVKLEMGDFIQGFDWPLKGLITGVYGSQRILNGIPK